MSICWFIGFAEDALCGLSGGEDNILVSGHIFSICIAEIFFNIVMSF